MTGINEWVKMTVLDFQGKFLFCLIWGKWGICGPKINLFELLQVSDH